MSENLLAIATTVFAIQDVFPASIKATIDRTFNQMGALTVGAQIRHAVDSNCLMMERQEVGNESHKILLMRRFVDTGFRIVELEQPQVTDQPKTVAEIEVTFAADYIVTTGEQPSADIVSAFEENVLFHVWPYWREYVQNSLSRMRLPPIVIPMYRRRRVPSQASAATESNQAGEK